MTYVLCVLFGAFYVAFILLLARIVAFNKLGERDGTSTHLHGCRVLNGFAWHQRSKVVRNRSMRKGYSISAVLCRIP